MVERVKSSRPTVTIACRLPGGLVLKTDKSEDFYEPLLGGGTRKTIRYVPTGDEYTVRGWNSNARDQFAKNRRIQLPAQDGGYALTPGIPADFWELWAEQHKDSDLIKNKFIFAAPSDNEAEAMKKDTPAKTGLEPLDPDHPPADLRRVTRADEETKREMG
jgi:hypothetical protein